MTPTRIAVLGTNIGSTLHIPAMRAAGFKVAALVGRDLDRTAERAAQFGIRLATNSVERVLDSDVEAVVIATPPATHHALALAAVAAGKHVICEKPLATTAALALEMRDAAAAAGVVHLVNYQTRWSPGNFMLRRLARDGGLGDLIQGRFIFDMPIQQRGYSGPEWWRRPETGGGWLRNYNTHGIDLVRYMLGEFGAVAGHLHADAGREVASDDSYDIGFLLRDGMQGMMAGSCRAWEPEIASRVHGTLGTAIRRTDFAAGLDSLEIADAAGLREIVPPDALLAELYAGPVGAGEAAVLPVSDDPYEAVHAGGKSASEQANLYAAFRRKIADRSFSSPAIADFGDGVAGMRIVEAVERSAAERRWIDI